MAAGRTWTRRRWPRRCTRRRGSAASRCGRSATRAAAVRGTPPPPRRPPSHPPSPPRVCLCRHLAAGGTARREGLAAVPTEQAGGPDAPRAQAAWARPVGVATVPWKSIHPRRHYQFPTPRGYFRSAILAKLAPPGVGMPSASVDHGCCPRLPSSIARRCCRKQSRNDACGHMAAAQTWPQRYCCWLRGHQTPAVPVSWRLTLHVSTEPKERGVLLFERSRLCLVPSNGHPLIVL